ncbi:zinc finger protein RFP-like isoform X1 [Pelodiscus sinensis]|uniref:zinc finger protein RFP-like isoform X1 n=1 Tax=Pelodiscus sinensis TaxID=13735 RepID=UPI003F6D3450
MASGNLARSFQGEVTCPVCLEYFTDPVSIECGHNFCRACLSRCWGESEPNFCPQCRETIPHRHLQPNYQLGNLMELVKRLQLPAGPVPEGQPECERHQEALKLFCQEDQAPICVVCDRSRAHRAHTVVPIEEAAQECKEQILSRLQRLREKRDALRGLESDWAEESERLLPGQGPATSHSPAHPRPGPACSAPPEADGRGAAAGGLGVRAAAEVLGRARAPPAGPAGRAGQGDWEEEGGTRRPPGRGHFPAQHHDLGAGGEVSAAGAGIAAGCEKRREQRRGGDVAASCAQVPGAGAENPGLPRREQSPGGRDRIPGGAGCGERTQASPRIRRITELAGTSRVIEAPGFVTLSPVDVMLDPDTAHSKLVLSEDWKSVRHEDTCQDLPDTPERFDSYPEVLGAEGFVGGRRYWEVEVGDKTEWTVGVCRESVSRKGKFPFSPKNGYWLMWLRNGAYKAGTSPSTLLPVSARPSRVGVFLDYEAGEVSFYNVTDRSHLFTFTGTFSGTLRPYFYTGGTNVTPLTICPVPAQAGGNPCP